MESACLSPPSPKEAFMASRLDPDSIGPLIEPQVKVMRIIYASLVAGVAAYLLFAWWQRGDAGAGQAGGTMVLITLVFALTAVVASFLVPTHILRTSIRQLARGGPIGTTITVPDDPVVSQIIALMGARQTSWLCGLAILDMAAFYTSFVTTAPWAPNWFVAVPVGLILLMVVRVPIGSALAEWVATTIEDIDAGVFG